MDPATLATGVLTVLIPYFSKGAEKFAQSAGESAYRKVAELWTTLRSKWTADEEASQALTKFEQKPERYRSVVEDVLKEKMAADESFLHELEIKLQALGPELQVIQKMRVTENVTGIEADEMTRGSASVTQEIDQGTGVTGIKIRRIGD